MEKENTMPTFDMRKYEKRVYVIRSDEFDCMVIATYGQKCGYEFVADQEAGNGCSYEFAVSIAHGGALDDYDVRRMSAFLQGDYPPPMARTILTDMCTRGLIQSGDYLITAPW